MDRQAAGPSGEMPWPRNLVDALSTPATVSFVGHGIPANAPREDCCDAASRGCVDFCVQSDRKQSFNRGQGLVEQWI